uniref:DUF4806 domain-containing protein n=1 Tax=Neogobius melanostomus TaxID=47308 RepID=A0A8C6SMU4_9GOBI
MTSFPSHPSFPLSDPDPSLIPSRNEIFKPMFRLGQSGRDPIPCSTAELHILTLLENIKQQVNQLSSVVNILVARTNPEQEQAAEMPEEITFPLTSTDEVENFETWLQEPQNINKKKQMIAILASIGGRSSKQVVWNILGRIFSDCIAKNINWKGTNGKMKFSTMNIKAVLARAVRKNHLGQQMTDQEINQGTIRWFNLASDRGGGRQKRAQKGSQV